MIIKIKSHKRPTFQNLLKYMINDKDRLFDSEGRSFAITHNLKGDSITAWTKQFQANELMRQRKRTDSVYLTHEILSFHKEDAKNITLSKMEAMAREYIKQRNLKGLYVAVPHFDKEHYHIHICASGVDKTGMSLRLPKADLQKLKIEIQNYQHLNFPELSKSIVNHRLGRSKNQDARFKNQDISNAKEKIQLTEKEFQFKKRTGRETESELLIGMLKTCYKKAISKDDFYLKLKECGLETYERGGKISGIKKANIKFRFSRLGFTEQRINDLSKFEEREKALTENRKNKQRIINRSK